MCSSRDRVSAREGIDDDVDPEARVVDGREALAVGVIIPLGAVVLAAVQHADAIALQHSLQVLVDEIVPPAVHLLARWRGSVSELEEAAEDLVIVGQVSWRAE